MLGDSEAEALLSSRSKTFAQEAAPVTGATDRTRLLEWFRRWHRPIRHWIAANTAVPAAEVDDLTQEVFLRLLRYSEDVSVTNPQAYLFRVATNVVQEWRQRCRVRLPHDDTWLDELLIESRDEPERVLERTKANQYLRKAIDELPIRQREFLLMHVDDELTYKEIAEQRGLTYRIVLRDLTRAYAALRRHVVAEDL
jgi:RNA polymerase sigma-70 factor (ECF subfamily)